jgi:hypothetical protein
MGWDVDDIWRVHGEDLVAERVEDLAFEEHVGLLTRMGVHRWGPAGRRVGDPNRQVAIAVSLPLHHVDILAGPWVNHHEVLL